jgi:hypothetical protein
MHNDRLSYAESFDEALEGLFTDSVSQPDQDLPQTLTDQSIRQLIDQANQAFEDYLDQMQQKQFDEAARSMQKLENALNQLEERENTGMEGNE